MDLFAAEGGLVGVDHCGEVVNCAFCDMKF